MGFSTNFDPADSMFSAGNFPGSSSGDRNSAKALYALLTGRVSSIAATGRLNSAGDEYVYNGELFRAETQDDFSFYAQDVWRWKPTVTFTLGLRYQYTLPMSSKNGVFTTITAEDSCGPSGFGSGPSADGATDRFCNMFRPGEFLDPTAPAPTYVQYSAKTKGYNTDYNNFAPNVGVSWRPNVQEGWLRTLLGDPEIASVAGGYSRSFNRERLDTFLNVYNGNPGQTVPATRSTACTTACAPGQFPIALPGEFPVLFRETDRLGPPAFQTTPLPSPLSWTIDVTAGSTLPFRLVPGRSVYILPFRQIDRAEDPAKETVLSIQCAGLTFLDERHRPRTAAGRAAVDLLSHPRLAEIEVDGRRP